METAGNTVTETVPRIGEAAARWRREAPPRDTVPPCWGELRDNGIGFEDRSTAVASLQEAVNEVTGEEGIWCSNPDGG
jgi:hypothetical protein